MTETDSASITETSPRTPLDVPTGSAWAAIFAASLGCATLGVLTYFSEASPRFAKFMPLVKSAGNLSGVTTLTIAAWLILWFLLHQAWKSRTIRLGGFILTLCVLAILIGLLGTFPPFIDWLSHEITRLTHRPS